MLERLNPLLTLLQRPFNPVLDLFPNWLRPFLDFRGRSRRTDFINIVFASLFSSVAAYFVTPSMEHRLITPEGMIELSGPKSAAEWTMMAVRWFLTIWLVVFLCRRLHDQNVSAMLLPLHFGIFWVIGQFAFDGRLSVIYVVSFWVTVFVAILRRGTVGSNRFGLDPRGWESVEHHEREQVRLKSGNI